MNTAHTSQTAQTSHTAAHLPRRVVITGMGMVSPLGRGTELAWRRLLSGASGLSRLPEDLAPDVPGQVAGQVPDLARDPRGLRQALHNVQALIIPPTVALSPKAGGSQGSICPAASSAASNSRNGVPARTLTTSSVGS